MQRNEMFKVFFLFLVIVLIQIVSSQGIEIVGTDETDFIIELLVAPPVTSVNGTGSNFSEADANLLFWRLDASNDPPTSNWDMGGFDFTDMGRIVFDSGGVDPSIDSPGTEQFRISSAIIRYEGLTHRFGTGLGDINFFFRAPNNATLTWSTINNQLEFNREVSFEEGLQVRTTVNASNITINDEEVCTASNGFCGAGGGSFNNTNVAYLNNTQLFFGQNTFNNTILMDDDTEINFGQIGSTMRIYSSALNVVNIQANTEFDVVTNLFDISANIYEFGNAVITNVNFTFRGLADNGILQYFSAGANFFQFNRNLTVIGNVTADTFFGEATDTNCPADEVLLGDGTCVAQGGGGGGGTGSTGFISITTSSESDTSNFINAFASTNYTTYTFINNSDHVNISYDPLLGKFTTNFDGEIMISFTQIYDATNMNGIRVLIFNETDDYYNNLFVCSTCTGTSDPLGAETINLIIETFNGNNISFEMNVGDTAGAPNFNSVRGTTMSIHILGGGGGSSVALNQTFDTLNVTGRILLTGLILESGFNDTEQTFTTDSTNVSQIFENNLLGVRALEYTVSGYSPGSALQDWNWDLDIVTCDGTSLSNIEMRMNGALGSLQQMPFMLQARIEGAGLTSSNNCMSLNMDETLGNANMIVNYAKMVRIME